MVYLKYNYIYYVRTIKFLQGQIMSQKKSSFLHYGQQDIDKTDINAYFSVLSISLDNLNTK